MENITCIMFCIMHLTGFCGFLSIGTVFELYLTTTKVLHMHYQKFNMHLAYYCILPFHVTSKHEQHRQLSSFKIQHSLQKMFKFSETLISLSCRSQYFTVVIFLMQNDQ